MPPKATEFQTSYESQTDDQVIDAAVDDSLRSYMDSGEQIFEQEEVDGQVLQRGAVVDQVRQNILRRLAEENQASSNSAEQERRVHRRYTDSLVSLYGSLQQNRKDYLKEERSYAELEEADRRDDERNANRLFRFFKFRNNRKNSIIKTKLALDRAFVTKVHGIVQRAEAWDNERKRYKETDMRKHYKAYDALAKSWYELTHERAVSALPEDATEEEKQAAVQSRAIPEEYTKKIVEYTGVYDMANISRKVTDATQNPTTAVTADDFVYIPYKRLQASHNLEDVENLTKTHTRILLLSEASEDTGIRTRYKFDASFLGDRAKRQFAAADTEELREPEAPAQAPEQAPPQAQEQDQAPAQDPLARHAENYHLESDRRDVNNRFLYSEKNAEILHAKLKRNGRTVYGFLMNGEFLTNDAEGEEDENAPGGRRVAGKQDMKFFGRRNWNKQEDAEKLRVAIRTAPFFKHVNARTIQYYTGYQADKDFGADFTGEMEEFWNKAGEDGQSREAAIQSLRNNPESYNNLDTAMKGPALVAYVMDAAKRPAVPNGQGFSFTDPQNDPVLRIAVNGNKKALQLACTAMLVDNDPRLWGLAKKIVISTKGVDKRTMAKLKYLPEQGMMMRMGLLDELANHQGAFADLDMAEDNPLDLIDIPRKKVYQEELNNRRGAGNWIKRNLLNGKIFSYAFKAASTGFSTYDNAHDAAKMAKNRDYKVSDETAANRLERKFWLAYGETASASLGFTSVLSTAGIAATWALGGDASVARDAGFQFFDLVDIVNQVVYMGKAVGKFVSYVWKKIKRKKDSELTEEELATRRAEERARLKDLDAGTFREVLKFLSTLVDFVDTVRDLASYHVVAKSEDGGWLSVANETWGSLIEFNGPLDYILNTAKNGIAIIEDITEIVTSTTRLARIGRERRSIETAITAFNRRQQEQRRQQQQQQPAADVNAVREEPVLTEEEQLGKAASENSQAQYFMSLTKMKSRKNRSAAAWDIGARTLSIAKDTFSMAMDPTNGITSKILRAALSPAPMLASFLGWAVGKLKYDRQNFKNNISQMLGDPKYAKTSYFDKVLRRETGIVSSNYLVDLARIFTSIDTHVLITKEEKTGGELELAKKVVGTLYGNVNEDSIKTIKLSAMMKYAGVSGDSDWRALLRNSIMDK